MIEKRVTILCVSVHDVDKSPADESALIAELVWADDDKTPVIRLNHPGTMSDVEVPIDMTYQLKCAMKILVDEAGAVAQGVDGGAV